MAVYFWAFGIAGGFPLSRVFGPLVLLGVDNLDIFYTYLVAVGTCGGSLWGGGFFVRRNVFWVGGPYVGTSFVG